MHYVIATTLIRASHYAAALGLAKDEWRSASNHSPRRIAGIHADVFHLLPGVSDELVATARWCAAKTDATIVDHRGY